jgi:DNA-binding NtrC family response regulator/tetratricopeptide (TPR) repeat protein
VERGTNMSRDIKPDGEYRKSCRKYLEDLIARGDFSAACRYFDSLQATWRGDSDSDSGIILRLGAVAFSKTSKPSRALTLIRLAINTLSKVEGETVELAECYMILGGALRELGKYREAEKAYRDAESIFRRNDDYSRSGVALNRIAGILFRKGELYASMRFLMEAMESIKKEGDKRKLAYLFGNIGRVSMLLGKLDSARENLKLNIELSSECNDEVELGRAYLNLGYIKIQQAEYDDAEEALDKGLRYVERNRMEKEAVIYLTYLGELLIKTERLDEAETVLGRAASQANKIASESLLAARSVRQLAELMLKRQNYRKALLFANKAMVLMKKIENGIEIGALLKIQAVCHFHLGQREKAESHFADAISTLEECRAKVELADCLAEAGQCPGLDVRQLMVYLCRAEELYSQCGLTFKAQAMQKLIGRLEVGRRVDADQSSKPEFPQNGKFPTENEKMKRIISHFKLLKNSDLPILLTGETGTGKDHLAKYFHSISRPSGPFVAVNCAAVPETLIESELFGYHRGAFTGADKNRPGLFLAADRGVLLLDEIGELPLPLQAKLLNVLETKKLRPLGTSDEVEVDVIIIAATNRNLYDMVCAGSFRQDLYYRLAGITFELPPLRKRKEDIPFLLGHFMQQSGLLKKGEKPERELIRHFMSFDWPGNIRQLENEVKRLSVLASMAEDGSILELSRPFFDSKREEKTNSLYKQVEELEIRLLTEALIVSKGNKSEAARQLGIHESTLRAKLKKYQLERIAC